MKRARRATRRVPDALREQGGKLKARKEKEKEKQPTCASSLAVGAPTGRANVWSTAVAASS